MTTIYDVALRAGVSISTVSRVLNSHPYVKDSTRKRVEELLAEMNYVPNYNASSLVRKRTKTIAVMLPDISNNFFATIFLGIEEKASQNGFVVIFGNTSEDVNKEKEYMHMFLERRVDGIILDPVSVKGETLRPILNNEVPLVLIDREIVGMETSLVSSNNEKGASELVEYLIERGHERIGLITASKETSVFGMRNRGYYGALKRAGLEVRDEYIKVGTKPVQEVGHSLVQSLVECDPAPTALFAANNGLAIGAAHGLRELGYTVPNDMAIVCFDELDNGAVLDPFFTSMNQQAYEMGVKAADLLLKQISKELNVTKKIYLDPHLFIRRST
ncbi:MAG TPA: LacI family transcriptional regulator [Firmicutes bacterium]|nr:LacI family transcriptional regulator [Bacillota bacterium]